MDKIGIESDNKAYCLNLSIRHKYNTGRYRLKKTADGIVLQECINESDALGRDLKIYWETIPTATDDKGVD